MWLRVLGPIGVRLGEEIGLGGPKQRLVLALLALRANRAVGVDELIDGLWEDDAPGRPRKTVQVYIAHLRSLLGGAGRIVSEPFGYRLVLGDDEFDLRRFERLVADARTSAVADPARAADRYRAALRLWPGRALADLRTFPAVERLVRPMDTQRCEVAEDLLALEVREGRAAESIPHLQALTEADPWRERPWALLMEAYYRTGRQSEALATYQLVRGLLADELGVDPGPELRRMERNILRQDPGLVVAAPDSPRVAVADERRPATFVSFGMADFDRLADDLDPEDLMAEVEAFRARARRIVGEHQGIVLAVDDGRLLACFGYPAAAEDDLPRGLRAALAAAGSQACAGVHTGLALFRPGTQVSAYGRIPAGAERLRRAAAVGEVRVSAEAAALAGGRFRLGLPDDDGACRVAAEQAPAGVPAHADLWGRDDELATIRQAMTGGSGPSVVFLCGEAGIGKTALVAAALAELPDTPRSMTVILRGDRYRRGQALHPIAAALAARYRDAGELSRDLDRPSITSKEHADLASALAALAGLGAAQGPAGGSRRQAVLGWLRACAERQPLRLVIEDLHDVDEETRELLDDIMDEVNGGVLLITSRTDDLPARLAAVAHRIHLRRLRPAEARALVIHTAGDRRLLTATVNHIVHRCDGHPLHLRELTLATAAAELAAGGVFTEVPASLQASLLARLDTLGPAKTLAQRCAAVGEPFGRDVAALICDDRGDPDMLDRELTELVAADVLRRTERHDEELFVYSHALLEDCAYASMSRSARTGLHRRLAARLQQRTPPDPGRLADHLAAAGDPGAAVQLWVTAAYEAAVATRFIESSTYARRALPLLPQLPAGDQRQHLELTATFILGVSLTMTARASTEVHETATRARELSVALGRTELLVPLDSMLTLCLERLGRYEEAVRQSRAALTAEQAANPTGRGWARLQMHTEALIWTGRLTEAAELSGRDAGVPDNAYATVPFGMTASKIMICAGLAFKGLAAFTADRPDYSRWLFDQATATAHGADSVDATCVTDIYYAITRQLAGDVPAVHRLAETSLEAALQAGSDWWFVWSQALLGWAVAAGGNPHEGTAMMVEAIEHTGESRQLLPYLSALTATGEMAANRPDAALNRAIAAVELAESTGERFLLPYVHLITADAYTAAGLPIDGATAHRRRAHDLAAQQGQARFARMHAGSPAVNRL